MLCPGGYNWQVDLDNETIQTRVSLPEPFLQKLGSDYRVNIYSVKAHYWRRKWQPTPVFLPGKFHGQRSLTDYSLWGCKELDTTEWLSTHVASSVRGNKALWNLVLIRPTEKIKIWLVRCYSQFIRNFRRGAFLVVQGLRLCSQCKGPGFNPWPGC